MTSAPQQLPTVHKQVAAILEISPEARESDKLLHLSWLVMHTDLVEKLGAKFEFMRDILLNSETPSMDTIGRARRKLQEQGLFPPVHPERRKMLSDEFIVALNRLDS